MMQMNLRSYNHHNDCIFDGIAYNGTFLKNMSHDSNCEVLTSQKGQNCELIQLTCTQWVMCTLNSLSKDL